MKEPGAPVNGGPGEIAAEALREMLERGEPVVVLDVRPARERAEWHIPGSVHHDVAERLRAADPEALAGVSLPAGRPVVTVCAAGPTSVTAARLLERRGFEARSLSGGMRAWSLAWNTAEQVAPDATLVQLRRTGKGCLSYLVGSGADAVVVDPSLDPDLYLRLARERGWTIRHVLDTHIHADHLSRSRALAERAGAALWLPEQRRARFAHRALADGAGIEFGRTRLHALRTPGHTLESSSFLVADRWLLTGDTLFPSAVGRPDLEASAAEAKERARLLHASLRRLFALDPGLLVLAGHTSAPIPFDRAVVGATLGEVRRVLDLPEDAERFADALLRRLPATPPNHAVIVEANEAGQPLVADPTPLEAGANRCAIS